MHLWLTLQCCQIVCHVCAYLSACWCSPWTYSREASTLLKSCFCCVHPWIKKPFNSTRYSPPASLELYQTTSFHTLEKTNFFYRLQFTGSLNLWPTLQWICLLFTLKNIYLYDIAGSQPLSLTFSQASQYTGTCWNPSQQLQIDVINCAVNFFLVKTYISCKGTGKKWMEIALHTSIEIWRNH